MTSLVNAALDRSRTVLASLLLLLIAGTFAYATIPREANPDINIPQIYVVTTLRGISPEDAERLLVRPVEQELRTIEGLKQVTASAYEGGANVILEFDAGFDSDRAVRDVREAVDRVRPDLPEGAEEPVVEELNLSLFPVLAVTLSGEVPERTLLTLARQLRDAIEANPSVLEVDVVGDREEMVEIVIDPMLIESYGINGTEVIDAFKRSNQLVAAGNLDTGSGRFAIKVPGLFEDLKDILNMPIQVSGDSVVHVSDITDVRRTFKDPDSFARVNGAPAIVLEVSKRTGENVISTITAVRDIVIAESADWPDAVEIGFSQDRSDGIRTMLADLQNNVISAILLVMILIVGVLGLRSAGLVGLAIPGSFLTGILVLAVMGLTVNIVVLFSLILAVGMLVDGAIVVTEYADRRMMEGADRRTAYSEAASRMAWPIIASTATTLAAFLPLLFWPGMVGEFMKFLPITLVATLTASLLMALLFVPTLGAHFGGTPGPVRASASVKARAGLPDQVGFTGLYIRILHHALRKSGLVLTAAILILVGAWLSFGHFGKGVEFFPDVEPDSALVLIHARGNLSIREQDALVQEVEARVLTLSSEFASVYTRTGAAEPGEDVAEDVIGQITIEFRDWDERRPADEILNAIRSLTTDLAGIHVETREPEAGPPIGHPIQVELKSREPELLQDAVARLRDFMEQDVSGLVDVQDTRPVPGIEWKLHVDRGQAAKYGLDVSSVGDAIRLVTNGLTVGAYRPDNTDEEIDIVVRYPEDWRTLDQLDQVRVVSDGLAMPIGSFVERTPQPAVGTLDRRDSRRVMTVKADVAPGVLVDTKVREIRAWLAEADVDPRVEVSFRGEDEEQQEAAAFLKKAFFVALFLMALILVTQFNSFYSAFLILSAVVLSTVGVLVGLMITGQPFGIVMTGVGVIALAGIVVNNNIVLIDTYERLRATAESASAAILRTGAERLRPVMLTTVTTILGLMPMVLQMNIDFVAREVSFGAPSTQWWKSLATAIVFGLSFATVLTLIVTPCALMLRARITERRARGDSRRPITPFLLRH